MSEGFKDNKLTLDDLLPNQQRRSNGPYAVFECFEEIPCNPCFTVCKSNAVQAFADINQIPRVDHSKCNGCSQCVSICPGLACFIIDETYSATKATIKLPFEFWPLPERGREVDGLDRDGNFVAKVKIDRVQKNKKLDRTNIITIIVPQEKVRQIRGIKWR